MINNGKIWKNLEKCSCGILGLPKRKEKKRLKKFEKLRKKGLLHKMFSGYSIKKGVEKRVKQGDQNE